MALKRNDPITRENCGELRPGDVIRPAHEELVGGRGPLRRDVDLVVHETDVHNGVCFMHPVDGEPDHWFAESPFRRGTVDFIFWAAR